MRNLFYKPEGAWAADFIPFYRNGTYHLFYLLDWRDPTAHGEGTPWYQITTKDFVHFTEQGEMLARGTAEEQDRWVFTGSVIEAEGRFHIFYTGHNPHLRRQEKPEQGVMHAVSDDLLHWRKIPEDTFFSPTDQYEPHDWRDPFVFWNDEAQEWWMLLAARRKTGPSRRRGCLALCASTDLTHWQIRDPFWSPGLYFTHECPDLFRMGDWWYLVYSEFSESHFTRYRMSRSLEGPWLAPANDTFDVRTFYAAKTASDGQRRFAFGWNPTRDRPSDSEGNWQWGGNLVVHEIIQEPDGALTVRVPPEVDSALNTEQAFAFQAGIGQSRIDGRKVELDAPDSFACAIAGAMPAPCKIETNITFAPNARACGLMLRVSDDLEAAYYVRLEPGRNRLVFDGWPRKGDVPFYTGLERPLDLRPGEPVELKVFVEGTVCEIYAGGKVAMSARMYERPTGNWGVFVQEGNAVFASAIKIGE